AGSGKSRTENYTWDASGRFIETVSNELGHTARSVYNQATGQVIEVTDANGRKTTTQYNGLGMLVSSTAPNGITQQSIIAWDQSKTGSLYKAIARATGIPDNTVYYNNKGQAILSESVNNQGQKQYVATEYNASNQVYRVSLPYTSSPSAYTTYAYDSYNRVDSKTLANGTGIVDYTYNGLVNKVTTPDGFSETTVDDAGFVSSVESESGTVAYTYYSTGNVHTQTSGGNTITYGYNAQWQQTSVSDGDAGSYSSSYNALGELLYSIDPRNHRYDFTYDVLGRIKTRTLVGGGDATEWFYDPSGNLGALDKVQHNSQNAETYSYDALGRVQSSTQYTYGPQNKTFTFGYS
ncbi:MAG: hypothetical protein MI892_21095, partial [Desulfobacterales bacterium]|nr:hypothetical protein [Desulfobacterales bacterium]